MGGRTGGLTCRGSAQSAPTPSARLFPLLGRRVSTPQGLGKLIQVLGETAAVILDADSERAVFVRLVEVLPSLDVRKSLVVI